MYIYQSTVKSQTHSSFTLFGSNPPTNQINFHFISIIKSNTFGMFIQLVAAATPANGSSRKKRRESGINCVSRTCHRHRNTLHHFVIHGHVICVSSRKSHACYLSHIYRCTHACTRRSDRRSTENVFTSDGNQK